jgi:hypothetical protein
MNRILGLFVMVMITATRVMGQDPGSQASPSKTPAEIDPSRVFHVTLRPQPEPDPPLKHELLPAYHQLQPGNAATYYYRALLSLPRDPKLQFGDQQTKWMDQPLTEFPTKEAAQWLKAYKNVFGEARRAVYRERCDWGLHVRGLKGMEPVELLLPELQATRSVARALSVKARLEIAERRFDDAEETLRIGYRLGNDVSRSPLLVGNLVGLAIVSIMNQATVDWIDTGGPNLYWALAGLPEPMVNMRQSLQQEMYLPMQMFPFLRDPESANYTPQQWREVFSQAMQRMTRLTSGSSNQGVGFQEQLAASGLIMKAYPDAKRALLQSGMDPQKVEAMPVGQVVAIQSARAYRKIYQEQMKWMLMPYWQVERQMEASRRKMREESFFGGKGASREVWPVASLLMPATSAATLAAVRVQRDIAALQAIEAIRIYTAKTGGKLPTTLSQLEQIPAPIDPVTGKHFVYELSGQEAAIILHPPQGKRMHGARYELKLKGGEQ